MTNPIPECAARCPSDPAIAKLVPDAQRWRRHLHAHPELLYDVDQTAAFVAERLREFGCDEVRTGVGRSGVVGVIKGRKGASGRAIGLRADMDALPIEETTNLPYRSTVPGRMHACGHDGHTAIMLGAARYLAATRDFAGSAVVIFQPAEEGGGGAKAMIDDGLMERFRHRGSLRPAQRAETRRSAKCRSARARRWRRPISSILKLEGKGGHAAFPHNCVDVIVAGAQIVTALQTIVSRSVDPLDSCVVSVARFTAGTTDNILPQSAELEGTVRTLSPAVRDLVERRFREIVAGIAAASGVSFNARLSPQLSGDDQSGEADRIRRRRRARGRRNATKCKPTSRR